MRKLKLQMQISLDGYVTVEYGGTNFNWDDEVKQFSIDNLTNVDSMILGRTTADVIETYWGGVGRNPDHEDYEYGKLMTEIPKIVFSKKINVNKFDNATIINGDIVEEIKHLKKKDGKDMIVYGGFSFVSSLIQHGLIDEFYLLLNPMAFGKGQTIFNSLKQTLQLKLEKCKPFACGTVLLFYKPKK
jgi:dihydrofolate reductase